MPAKKKPGRPSRTPKSTVMDTKTFEKPDLSTTKLTFALTAASEINDWFGIKKKFDDADEMEKELFLDQARGLSSGKGRKYELSKLKEYCADATEDRKKEEQKCRLTFQDETKLGKVMTVLTALKSVFQTQFKGIEAHYVAQNLSTFLAAKAEETRLVFMKESLMTIVTQSSAQELKEKEEQLTELKKVLEMTPDNPAFDDFKRLKKAEIKELESTIFKMKHEDEDVSEMPADLQLDASQVM